GPANRRQNVPARFSQQLTSNSVRCGAGTRPDVQQTVFSNTVSIFRGVFIPNSWEQSGNPTANAQISSSLRENTEMFPTKKNPPDVAAIIAASAMPAALPVFSTVKQFSAKHPAFPEGSVRRMIFDSEPRQSTKGEIP